MVSVFITEEDFSQTEDALNGNFLIDISCSDKGCFGGEETDEYELKVDHDDFISRCPPNLELSSQLDA